MANVFLALPVPAGDGVGAWVDTSAVAPGKTVTVDGGAFAGTLTLELSNDAQASAVPVPVQVFNGPTQAPVEFEAPAQFMRVRRSGSTVGTLGAPTVAVAGEGTTTNIFGAMAVPAGDGVGALIDLSGGGAINAFSVAGGDPRSQIIVEISTDGVNFSGALVFTGGGGVPQIFEGIVSAARVRRRFTQPGGAAVLVAAGSGGSTGGGGVFPGFGGAPPAVASASAAGGAGTASRSNHTHALDLVAYTPSVVGMQAAGVLQQTFAAGVATPGVATIGTGLVPFGANAAAGTLSTDTAFFWDSAGHRVFIGVNSSIAGNLPAQFNVVDQSASSRGVTVSSYLAGGQPQGALVRVRKARGTYAAPLIVPAGDQLGAMVGFGWDGATFTTGAAAGFFTDPNIAPAAGAMATRFAVWTGTAISANGPTSAPAATTFNYFDSSGRFACIANTGGGRAWTDDLGAIRTIFSQQAVVASAAGATLNLFLIDGALGGSVNATITGVTNIATAAGFNFTVVDQPRYTAGPAAINITAAASFVVRGEPVGIGAGGPTFTNAYAIWVQSGTVRLDGSTLAMANAIASITAAGALGITGLTTVDLFSTTGIVDLRSNAAGALGVTSAELILQVDGSIQTLCNVFGGGAGTQLGQLAAPWGDALSAQFSVVAGGAAHAVLDVNALTFSLAGTQSVTKSGGSLFLQTTDANDLVFRVNSVEAFRVDNASTRLKVAAAGLVAPDAVAVAITNAPAGVGGTPAEYWAVLGTGGAVRYVPLLG